jgi:allantoicase
MAVVPSFAALADLASAKVGGEALAASDEFFGAASRLVEPDPPAVMPGKSTPHGKWVDAWETRRRRTPGHDWAVIRLGIRGRIHGVDVDTTHIDRDYPPQCAIEALDAARAVTKVTAAKSGAPWIVVVPSSPVRGNSHNYFELRGASSDRPWTHVRLNIHPDGGVARLRVYGESIVDWAAIARADREIDLADIRLGGLVVAASDMQFGAKDNLIMPGRAATIDDGWETQRRRGAGYDWAIVKLGTSGTITGIEIDTAPFKGSHPDSASVEGCFAPNATLGVLGSTEWFTVLPQTKLRPNFRHVFGCDLRDCGRASHVRLNIYPDGGVSRLRVFGRLPAT